MKFRETEYDNQSSGSISASRPKLAEQLHNSSASSDALANSSSDLFLQLLIAQLKTQDPTSPMDPTQMVGQMLSMNQLNELIQIRQLMQGTSTTTPTQPTTTAPTGA